ncbi:hypothetical protein EDB89DRAFT_1906255 [Lactarius sanguifluus]|nr:hypothetical protein EDB89DRAFT_1906255 [Lactarius sanguifluus]
MWESPTSADACPSPSSSSLTHCSLSFAPNGAKWEDLDVGDADDAIVVSRGCRANYSPQPNYMDSQNDVALVGTGPHVLPLHRDSTLLFPLILGACFLDLLLSAVNFLYWVDLLYSAGTLQADMRFCFLSTQVVSLARSSTSSLRSLMQTCAKWEDLGVHEVDNHMMQQTTLPNLNYMDSRKDLIEDVCSQSTGIRNQTIQVDMRSHILPQTPYLSVNNVNRFLSARVVSLAGLRNWASLDKKQLDVGANLLIGSLDEYCIWHDGNYCKGALS